MNDKNRDDELENNSSCSPSTTNLPRWARVAAAGVLYSGAVAFMIYGHEQTTESSNLMRLVTAYYESSDQAVALIDQRGNVVIWSKGLEELLGWTKEEAKGRNIKMLVPMNMLSRHSEKFAERIKRIKEHGISEEDKTMVVRCEAMTKGLDKIDLRITLRFFQCEGEPYMNATFDKADKVEFFKAPPSSPIQSENSLFGPTSQG